MAKPVPSESKFLTAPQLCERWCGISGMTLERRIESDANFPKAKYFGRLRLFSLPEVESYERSLVVATYPRKKAAVR